VFRRQRSRKTEVERAISKGSELVVGIHVLKLQLYLRISSQIRLHEQR
jgi:hypothetical protein